MKLYRYSYNLYNVLLLNKNIIKYFILNYTKNIITEKNQPGRLAWYIPTMPYGRNKTFYRFEGYPFRKFCSERLNTRQKIISYIKALPDNDIHYSRLNYFKHFET